MQMQRAWVLMLLVAVLIFLAACQTPSGENENPSDATGTVDSRPAASTTPLAQVPESSQAASPTAAPLVATPSPEATTALAQATATRASIPGLIGPDEFPENVNPLTGQTVEDPALLNRRPVAIKISNYPPVVRPQSGLNNADLLFEHYAEGGVTRFTAVFYGQDADPVGSIRSARLIDLEIPRMYDAAFAYSGASGPVRQMLRNAPFFDRIISPDFGHGGFYRIEDPDKAFEHTLFTDTPRLRAILEDRGQNTRPSFQTNLAFHEDPPLSGSPANTVEVRYVGTIAFWRYDPVTERYFRATDGAPHLDANTGQQVSFKNVVVLGAHHEDTEILEDLVGGGHYSIQIQVWGQGPVTIFRNGQRFEGRWRRDDPGDMVTFTDLEGNILPLAPGNTFFQLVPLGFEGLIVGE